MLVVAGFLFIVSIILFVFAGISRRDEDFGQASVYLSIALMLLFIDLILFIALIKFENLFA